MKDDNGKGFVENEDGSITFPPQGSETSPRPRPEWTGGDTWNGGGDWDSEDVRDILARNHDRPLPPHPSPKAD